MIGHSMWQATTFRRVALVGVAAAAFGLTGCFPPPPSRPRPPSLFGCGGLVAPDQADDAGRAAVEGTPAESTTGEVRLVTVEEGAAGTEITTATVGSSDEAAAFAAEAGEGGDLVGVEVDQPVTATAPATDPRRVEQWALDRVRFEDAWGTPSTATGAGQTVAVIDTGVDAAHPDLTGRVLPGRVFLDLAPRTPGGGTDPSGHGTHVAGVIAAALDNGAGIAGAAPGALILPVQVLDARGNGWSSDVARGVNWAARHGATVINLSLGAPGPSCAQRVAIQRANERGVTVVAAAGNTGAGGGAQWPAAYDFDRDGVDVIAVAATTSLDQRVGFSTTGAYVDIAAPGAGILSTVPGAGYGLKSGTSMSTPYVAAAAALVRATGCPPTGVRDRLLGAADDLGAPGVDLEFGAGLVDPYEATGG